MFCVLLRWVLNFVFLDCVVHNVVDCCSRKEGRGICVYVRFLFRFSACTTPMIIEAFVCCDTMRQVDFS